MTYIYISRIIIVLLFLFTCQSFVWNVEEPSDNIRLNQIGFYKYGPKTAIIVEQESDGTFLIIEEGKKDPLFKGDLSKPRKSAYSGKVSRIADFTSFSTPGKYYLQVPGMGRSHIFEIKNNVHEDLAKASIKAFYFHRVSTELPEEFAGKWSRPTGHPDDRVLIHSSATFHGRPEGFAISSPKGWYDAGDYNKYIVNSGITVGTMLSAYEDFPEYFKSLNLKIPESKNKVPDLLDEILWNLRWMATMQDPNDGGVYHKLTNANFDSINVMPHEAQNLRYVVQKGTSATLNFAAVMAQASRVFKEYENAFPGLSDSCLSASIKAWNWAENNPNILYDQIELNKSFKPQITTGAYGDKDVKDEFIWAASELYVTTKDRKFFHSKVIIPNHKIALPSWNQVRALGYYSLLRHQKDLSPEVRKDLLQIKKIVVGFADSLLKDVPNQAYNTVMGTSPKHFIWGSSSVAANQGIVLINAYLLTSDRKYLDHALSNLDYLLGRNATGYSFVTGFGEKSIKNPHQRLAVADGIEDPIPGWLSGGPNANAPKQDNCATYSSQNPDETFTDDSCSYASNEIAINWNAPLVYLTGAMEALQEQAGYIKN